MKGVEQSGTPRGERTHLRSRAQSLDSAASCAFAQSPRSPRPYRISQSIWFPLFRLKHPFYTQRPFASTGITPCGRRCRACGTFPSSYRSSVHLPATMASSDSSLRFRYNEVSRVPLLNFPDTRSSYAPRGRLRVASRSPSATCPPLRSGAFRFDYPSRFDSLLLAS